MSSGERYKEMSEETVVEGSYDPQLLNNAFEQGYRQGWLHSQQALAEWVGELGTVDKENEGFYQELSQVIAKLEIVQDEPTTTDMSEVSEDNGSDNDSTGV